MNVIKRDGREEAVKFDKVTSRIHKLCYGLSELVDPTAVAMKVIEGIYEGVTTSELDSLAAEVAARDRLHPGGRIHILALPRTRGRAAGRRPELGGALLFDNPARAARGAVRVHGLSLGKGGAALA